MKNFYNMKIIATRHQKWLKKWDIWYLMEPNIDTSWNTRAQRVWKVWATVKASFIKQLWSHVRLQSNSFRKKMGDLLGEYLNELRCRFLGVGRRRRGHRFHQPHRFCGGHRQAGRASWYCLVFALESPSPKPRHGDMIVKLPWENVCSPP
jgi:hypothetical protein